MSTDTATPEADLSAVASTGEDTSNTDPAAPAAETKPEAAKTPEQLRIEQLERDNKRMQRGIDRRTRQLAEERARNQLTPKRQSGDNDPGSDGDTVSLTKAELQRQIREEAARLAPTLSEQTAEVERRQGVIASLTKTLGPEKFDQLASDLDDAFGGLQDSSGRPKPALEAVFEADNPAHVIEYLADPEHADEAEALSRMSPVQAGKAVARLEDKLKAAAAEAKPKPSSAPEPLERIRGTGAIGSRALNDLDGDDFDKRRREQIKNRK